MIGWLLDANPGRDNRLPDTKVGNHSVLRLVFSRHQLHDDVFGFSHDCVLPFAQVILNAIEPVDACLELL